MQTEEDEIPWRIGEVQKYFGGETTPLHKSTVHRKIKQGLIPPPYKNGALSLWSPSRCKAARSLMMGAREITPLSTVREEQLTMSNVEKIDRLPAAPKLEVSLSYDAHPLAALMPMMDDDAFANLKADIAKRGIEHPMTTYQGLLLDGRNRQRAAKELGLKLTTATSKTSPVRLRRRRRS